MRKKEVVEIGSFKYEVLQLNTTEASDGLLKVQKLMAEAQGDLDKAVGMMSPEDFRFFQKAFANQTRLITTKTDEETGLSKTTAVPLAGVFENHFAGDMLFDMLQWLTFCLVFNFGFFFKRLTADGGLIKTMVEKALSTSNAPPTGESGA